MKFLKTFSAKMAHVLALYGGWGLAGIAFLDSGGLSLPGLKDVLLIYLSGKHPPLAWLYALGCAVGTAVGSLIIYWIGRTGARVLRRKTSDKEMSSAMKWIARNDFVTVVVASLLPPPLPFKPFLLASGVLRISSVRLLAALMVGGALRFGAEAWIGVRFGQAGPEYLKQHIVWISLALAAVIVVLTAALRKFRQAENKTAGADSPSDAAPPRSR